VYFLFKPFSVLFFTTSLLLKLLFIRPLLVFRPTAEARLLKEGSINEGLLLLESERFVGILSILFYIKSMLVMPVAVGQKTKRRLTWTVRLLGGLGEDQQG
jgi:hypothetical protein